MKIDLINSNAIAIDDFSNSKVRLKLNNGQLMLLSDSKSGIDIRYNQRWYHIGDNAGIQMRKTELIPVIHVLNEEQTLQNVKTCDDLGVKKVFIIMHGGNSNKASTLQRLSKKIKEEYPGFWVGINYLEDKSLLASALKNSPLEVCDAVWTDNTPTYDDCSHRHTGVELFGGMMFKYQPRTMSLEEAYLSAKSCTTVGTTSGEGTGIAMREEKLGALNMFREFHGYHPIAIASGVSAANVGSYIGNADYLLVASSITESSTELIYPHKLAELIRIINALQ